MRVVCKRQLMFEMKFVDFIRRMLTPSDKMRLPRVNSIYTVLAYIERDGKCYYRLKGFPVDQYFVSEAFDFYNQSCNMDERMHIDILEPQLN